MAYSASSPISRCAVHILVHLRLDRAARRDADAAGHRGHRPHHRHGGRFERPDLRAHPRGSAYGPLDHFRARRWLQARFRHHRRLQRRPCSSRPPSCISSASGPVRGFAVSLGLGILTSIVTAVTMTRMMIALWYRWPAKDAADMNGRRAYETSSPRAREHQIRLHALPPRELSVLGALSIVSVVLFLFVGDEFRHRFRRRHADGTARQVGAGRSRSHRATSARSSVSATSRCRVSARRPT